MATGLMPSSSPCSSSPPGEDVYAFSGIFPDADGASSPKHIHSTPSGIVYINQRALSAYAAGSISSAQQREEAMYGSVVSQAGITAQKAHHRSLRALAAVAVLMLMTYLISSKQGDSSFPASPYLDHTVLRPSSNRSIELYHSLAFREASLERFQRALRIPTEVYDTCSDPRDGLQGWEPFLELQRYFEDEYPLVHAQLDIHKVNELGYVVIWNGTDEALAPLLFMAHQDVIPVEKDTWDQWTHPPFSAHFDGTRVWARGAADTKNLVVALFEVFEQLLKDGLVPQRTMIMSLGYDEEAIGRVDGANSLVRFIAGLYGEKSLYAVLDEGGSVVELDGVPVAAVGVREKGYLDINIELDTTGGHSSRPPDHTGIGIMSQLVVSLEKEPFGSKLTSDNPLLDLLQVVGARSEEIDDLTRELYLGAKHSHGIRSQLSARLASDESLKYLQRTSQAVDLIHSGVKINSLPEKTTLGINHRISMELTAQDCVDRVLKHVLKVSDDNNLGVVLSNGTVLSEGDHGLFNVSVVQPLDPSPVSRTLDSQWNVLAGSIRHTFQDVVANASGEVSVAPMIVGGYTDASRYWPLSDNVYRFIGVSGGAGNAHAIDEYLELESHIQTVCFLYDYILNVDEHSV